MERRVCPASFPPSMHMFSPCHGASHDSLLCFEFENTKAEVPQRQASRPSSSLAFEGLSRPLQDGTRPHRTETSHTKRLAFIALFLGADTGPAARRGQGQNGARSQAQTPDLPPGAAEGAAAAAGHRRPGQGRGAGSAPARRPMVRMPAAWLPLACRRRCSRPWRPGGPGRRLPSVRMPAAWLPAPCSSS